MCLFERDEHFETNIFGLMRIYDESCKLYVSGVLTVSFFAREGEILLKMT